MPDADFLEILFCWSPKEALARACSQALFVTFDGPTEGPILDTYKGYRAYYVIRHITSFPSYYYAYVFVMVTLPSEATMGALDFLQDEAELRSTCRYRIDEISPGPTWLDFTDAFTEIWTGVLTEFIEDVCEAFIEIGEGSAILLAEDEVGVLGVPVTIITDANVNMTQITLTGSCRSFDNLHTGMGTSYRSGQPRTQIQQGGGGGDFSAIVTALQDIALQDYEIALNNGSAIFRVRGRSAITGPGGGG